MKSTVSVGCSWMIVAAAVFLVGVPMAAWADSEPNYYNSLSDYFLKSYQNQQKHTDVSIPTEWRLGQNIQSGDSFTYLVCGSTHAVQYTWPYNCYVVRIDFLYAMPHHAYDQLIWITDVSFWRGTGEEDKTTATTSSPHSSNGRLADHHRTVMFVTTFDMQVHPTSSADRLLADSLSHTLMDLASYNRQTLAVGSHWGDIKTHFSHTPLTILQWDGHKTATLGYDVGTHESRTLIRSDIPLPVYSKWYEPNDAVSDIPPRLLHEYAILEIPARFTNTDSNYDDDNHNENDNYNDDKNNNGGGEGGQSS